MRKIVLASLPLLALTSACTPTVEAPEELEPLATFFWNSHRDGDDAALRDGVVNIEPIIRDLTTDGPKVGSLPELSADDLAWVGLDGTHDPAEAPGFFLVSRSSCDLQTIREIVASDEQATIHPGVYDAYEREYHDDVDAFTGGQAAKLEYTTTYTATPTADTYTASLENYVRWVEPGATADGTEVVPIMTQATWLPSPASFEVDSSEFTQDYQSSVFFEAADGDVYHFNAIWRWMKLGIVSVNDDAYVSFFLDGLIEWEEQTDAACETWPDIGG